MRKAKRKAGAAIDKHTARPASAYPQTERAPIPYVDQFSRALGLRPAETMFGKQKTKV